MSAAPELELHEHDADPAEELGVLAGTLRAERRLLERLEEILDTQREGVADDDLEAVDGSVYAARRVLLTLSEARRRRRGILRTLFGDPDLPLRELEDAVEGEVPSAVLDARDALLQSAARLSRVVKSSQRLLEEAMEENDRHLRQLHGSSGASSGYGASGEETGDGEAGRLFNRQV